MASRRTPDPAEIERTAEVAARKAHESMVAEVEAIKLDRDRLAEGMSSAMKLLRSEDVGWADPSKAHDDGLTLLDLKKWSKEIRTALTGTLERAPNPHMRNGFMLRQSYIWSNGIKYSELPAPSQGKKSAKTAVDDLLNQRNFFDASARRRRELALFADGLYVAVCFDGTREMRTIPITEITDTHRDDVYANDILAYRWSRNEVDPESPTKARKVKHYWVFTDQTDKKNRPESVRYNGNDEPVLAATAFDLIANRPDGFAFGSPDAIAAVVWARVVRDLLMNGVKMQEALAMFSFGVKSESGAGVAAAAAAIKNGAPAGSAAAMGNANSLVPLSSAGKGYDFDSIRLVVSTMAASLHVSGIALAADTAFAGSSYGAAQTLDMPTRLAMENRRSEHVEFDKRVLRHLGAPESDVWFEPFLDTTSLYRDVQAAMLAWSSGTMSADDFRAMLERIFGEPFGSPRPRDTMVPNTKGTWAFQNPAPSAAPAAPSGTPISTGSPGQGQSSPAGSNNHAGDVTA